MIYSNIVEGIFLERINRFVAKVLVDGELQICHIKSTGRCKELFIKGAKVYLQHIPSPTRKTSYDLISVYKNEKLVNVDSQVVNKVVFEHISNGTLLNGTKEIKAEYKYKKSRIDFMVKTKDKKALIEVKGVTLENNKIAMFPDAPTERGVKHINELISSIDDGFVPYIIFVVQMSGCQYFTPNKERDKAFYNALLKARESNVTIMSLDCNVTLDTIFIQNEIPVII